MRMQYLLLPLVPVLILFAADTQTTQTSSTFLGSAETNSQQMIQQGRQTFRFDTFGDESFWGGQLELHKAVNQLTPK